jgi:hypothetical protein
MEINEAQKSMKTPPIVSPQQWDEGYPQTAPYQWWNCHDRYPSSASPDPKSAKVLDSALVTLKTAR